MVYEPAEDTTLLAKYAKLYSRGDVLDMGSGNGEQAASAQKNPDVRTITCVDVDPEAVKHLKKRFDKVANVIRSDLFKSVKARFDTIIFNPPYLPQDKGIEDIQIYGGKKGSETIVRFIDEAGAHLKPEGIILLLFSSLSRPQEILDHLKKSLYESTLLETVHISFEDLFVYKIEKSAIRASIEKHGISHLAPFSKGKRGWVLKGKQKNVSVCVKIKNPDSEADRLSIEADWLKRLNTKCIGPKLLAHGEGFLVTKFVDGEQIMDFLSHATKKQAQAVLSDLIDQCRIMDNAGVDKFEMHHPVKHVLVDKRLKVTQIDFERCRPTESPRNVTQICQFIVGHLSQMLRDLGIAIDKQAILDLARSYKNSPDDAHFKSIKQVILGQA